MKTTRSSQADEGLQFQLDKKTLQVRIELSSLLRSLGAPTTMVMEAIPMWKSNSQIKIKLNPESELPLCFLPVSLIPQFIDQTLDQLSSESRAAAMQFRDLCSTVETQVSTVETMKRSNNPKVLAVVRQWITNDPASYALHELMALQQKHSAGAAPTKAAQGSL